MALRGRCGRAVVEANGVHGGRAAGLVPGQDAGHVAADGVLYLGAAEAVQDCQEDALESVDRTNEFIILFVASQPLSRSLVHLLVTTACSR